MWLASIVWFHPRLAGLLAMADSAGSWMSLAFFVGFTEFAWLYAWFNIGVTVFAISYRWATRNEPTIAPDDRGHWPPVAVLYTTCDDFVEDAAHSCITQSYPSFTVYILDDSANLESRRRVDAFARSHGSRVRVVRRPERRGFKAGNLNHGLLRAACNEPLFALSDADEVLPADFLRRLVPRLLAEEQCGFIQANHRFNPSTASPLATDMGPGIDIHWRWYHPLRNSYGFVMLLGHGALVRRETWESIGGFPELVSEDLAFALRARAHGWHGRFAEDVICLEDFPDTVRAFRVRHMKWTRGTCEFLLKELGSALRLRTIPLVEKLDVLIPTLNLPMTALFFLFIVNANLVIASMYGSLQHVSFNVMGQELGFFVRVFDSRFGLLNNVDFLAMTVLTIISPVLCFVIEMVRRPFALFRFLARSLVLYGALGALSAIGVLFFLITRKAVFHVTAARVPIPVSDRDGVQGGFWTRVQAGIDHVLVRSHPDHWVVQSIEMGSGIAFVCAALATVQVPFLGLAVAYVLQPVLHHLPWNSRFARHATFVPIWLAIIGLFVSGFSLQTAP